MLVRVFLDNFNRWLVAFYFIAEHNLLLLFIRIGVVIERAVLFSPQRSKTIL